MRLHKRLVRSAPPRSLRRSFTTSILWIHLSVLAVALLAGSFVLIRISLKQTVRQAENSLTYMAYQMENLTNNLLDIRKQLVQDKSLLEYLSSDRSYDVNDILLQQSVMSHLSLIVRSYSYISSITIFQGDGPVLCVNESRQIQGRMEDTPLPVQSSDGWKNLTPTSGIIWGGQYHEAELFLARYRSEAKTPAVISFLLPLPQSQDDRSLSVLSINVSLDYFHFLYSKNTDLGASVSLMDAEDNILFSAPETSGTPDSLQHFYDIPITCPIPGTDWSLSESSPFSVLLRDSIPLLLTVSAIFLTAIAAAVLLSSLAGRRLLNPFQEIIEQMNPINDGKLEQRISPQKYDELNILVNHFNYMMERIQKLVAANANYAEEKRLLEMETLQSQINPHFLYNSLTTIRWMASMARAENVCQALFSLGNIIRPVFSQPGIFWSLETEQTFVENFIDIMDYRFGIKTDRVFDIPESLFPLPVLRFILQPIVENFFQHGLQACIDAGQSGQIRIRAEQDDEWLDIYVQDNGSGIEEELLAQLNERLRNGSADSAPSDSFRTGIGLTNVNRRILLQYGEGSGLHIWSRANHGTTVRIRISCQDSREATPPSSDIP